MWSGECAYYTDFLFLLVTPKNGTTAQKPKAALDYGYSVEVETTIPTIDTINTPTVKTTEKVYTDEVAKKVDIFGESGIIKTRKLAQEKKFNYLDFDEVTDSESVEKLKAFASEKMGIHYISGIDKLKTGKQAQEVLTTVQELSRKYGNSFSRISLIDYGNELTVAETAGKELRLNIQLFNRPDALKAVLDKWNETGFIPKGCSNVQYIAKHEYYHLLTQGIIDEPHSKITFAVKRAVKDGCEAVSMNGKYDFYEFVADLLSAKTLTKPQRKLKDTIIKFLK